MAWFLLDSRASRHATTRPRAAPESSPIPNPQHTRSARRSLMAKTVADVMKMVKENEVKFVDFRFTDTRGKEQHVTVPVSALRRRQVHRRPCVRRLVDRRLEGHRSVRHAADARPDHRQHRPVLRRAHADPHLRRARARRRQALRARPALAGQARRGLPQGVAASATRRTSAPSPSSSSSTGALERRHVGLLRRRSIPKKRRGARGKEYEGGNSGHRPAVKGGYFPVPPVDSFQDMRCEMCLLLEQMGIPVEVHHHEVGGMPARRSSAPSSPRWCSAPTGCRCRST